jgi:hypothetical protein
MTWLRTVVWLADHKPARALGSGVGALLAAAAAFYLLWAQWHPDGHTGWQLTCIVVTGLIAVLSALVRIVRIYTIDNFEARQARVLNALRALAWGVHDDVRTLASGSTTAPGTTAPGTTPAAAAAADELVRTLGCSVWIVGGGRFRAQQLVRIGRERVNRRPVPSHITWTVDKGIIGACWRTGQEQVVDTSAYDATHAHLTRAEWDALDAGTRRGLTYDEYQRIATKYGTVIAMPLLRQETVVGVVALDAPPGSYRQLCHPVVTNTVGATAELIMNILT